MISTRHRRKSAVVTVLLALGLLAGTVAADADPSDTISIVRPGESTLPTSEVASRLAEATFAAADRVLIGRDDEFADAMTSGLLQGDSPLLLVPTLGPVPQPVLDQIALLDPAEVVLLGGTSALSPAVEDELAGAGYEVTRTFGASRTETAIEIARDAAPSDTVIIARAFADPDVGDPTQAFADALAAGAWSARTGWPILLTQTDVLTETTRNHLVAGSFDRAVVLGGAAAISDAVETEVGSLVGNTERVAGTDRFGTAVAVAEESGAPTAAAAARVILVDGQGPTSWAGGFAAAGHAAVFDAPVLLTSGDVIPPATAAWLSGGRGSGPAGGSETSVNGGDDQIRLTCVTPVAVCDDARSLLGLPSVVGGGQVLFQADDTDSEGATGTLYLVDLDGAHLQAVGPCNRCDDLRLSPDGRTAVGVEDGVLVLRRAPDFSDATALVTPLDGQAFSDPQFTPDGQTVVATRTRTGGGTAVVSVGLDDPAVQVLAPGSRLPGSDAVGPVATVPSGVGVLVADIRVDGAAVTSELGLIDVRGGDVELLETTPGIMRSATLSPDGSAYALDAGGRRPGRGRLPLQTGSLP